MATTPGNEQNELTYAQRNPQTVQIGDGVRIRKTNDYYVLERLKADLNWEALTQLGAAVWGDITGDVEDQADVQPALGFTAEDVANKSTNVATDGASDTKYPSVKAVKTYADVVKAAAIAASPNTVFSDVDPAIAGAAYWVDGVLTKSTGP